MTKDYFHTNTFAHALMLSDSGRESGCVGSAMRNGDHDFSDSKISGDVAGLAGDFDDGRTGQFVNDFYVSPLDAFGPAGTEHL